MHIHIHIRVHSHTHIRVLCSSLPAPKLYLPGSQGRFRWHRDDRVAYCQGAPSTRIGGSQARHHNLSSFQYRPSLHPTYLPRSTNPFLHCYPSSPPLLLTNFGYTPCGSPFIAAMNLLLVPPCFCCDFCSFPASSMAEANSEELKKLFRETASSRTPTPRPISLPARSSILVSPALRHLLPKQISRTQTCEHTGANTGVAFWHAHFFVLLPGTCCRPTAHIPPASSFLAERCQCSQSNPTLLLWG